MGRNAKMQQFKKTRKTHTFGLDVINKIKDNSMITGESESAYLDNLLRRLFFNDVAYARFEEVQHLKKANVWRTVLEAAKLERKEKQIYGV